MAPEPKALSPMPILQAMGAFRLTDALRAAINLNLFTRIGEGHDRAASLAQACNASTRGTEILADFLTVAGLLLKSDGRYSLSPEAAAFLDRRSPACIASAVDFWGMEWQLAAAGNLTESVRRGGAPQVIHDPKVWVTFARAMAPMMRMPAQYVAEHLVGANLDQGGSVLDIAGGHGLYGIAIAQRCPAVQVTLVDAEQVGVVAKENAAAAGVAARYQVRGGSALPGSKGEVNFGSGHKLILVTNFLHHFGPPTIEAFLKKCRAALAPRGRLLALDFVPNPDRVSPPFPAAFSLTMLADTAEGRAYTETEYRGFFTAAGFSSLERHDLPGMPATAFISDLS